MRTNSSTEKYDNLTQQVLGKRLDIEFDSVKIDIIKKEEPMAMKEA